MCRRGTLTRAAPALGFLLFLATLVCVACSPKFRQVPDPEFIAHVRNPPFLEGDGPLVVIDEGHHNFHTAEGRYQSFAKLLRRDGFRVASRSGPFGTPPIDADILVIANALAAVNAGKWELPTPSAFAESEVGYLDAWIRDGGSLLFIADHMPFPGSGSLLAERLGILFINGYAFHDPSIGELLAFEAGGGLTEHPVTAGRRAVERVERVITFTGQVFRPKPEYIWEPLLVLPEKTTVLMPVRAGKFDDQTPRFSAEGLWQGALRRHGRGRIAVFGEAAMFSAQRIEGDNSSRAMGMNHPEAVDNPQFLLNVMHWLSGIL